MNLARLRALHAALRALEVDATTIPCGPGLGLSGSGRAQRPGQTAFVPVTRQLRSWAVHRPSVSSRAMPIAP
jgi:hypothetical protein